MEDSYANYTIDPEALRQGMEVLGFIATGIAIGAAIINPVGATAAGVIGFCTAVGVMSDSFSVGSYLVEGNTDGAWNKVWDIITFKIGGKILKGFMKTGAELTEEEMKQAEAVLKDMPHLAYDIKNFILENRGS